ncbi:MAG: ribonuclease J [Acidobacteriota bacterium]
MIPLGGLGEFGLNLMVFRSSEGILVVDSGLMFPEQQFLGVDIVIPDMSYLVERADEVRGVVLSHGHEDHIGALPYMFEWLRAPIYASPYTLGLVREKVREHDPQVPPDLRTLEARQTAEIGPFRVEFMQVTHSIPDAMALAIHSPAGLIVHTCDFKLDQTPVNGKHFDYQRFSQHGDAGVRLLLSDSTNAERSGYTPSESSVRAGLRDIMRNAPGRLFVTTFGSHIHRVQQLIDLARQNGRRVCLLGRSLNDNVRVADALGYISVPSGIMLEARQVSGVPRDEILIITTGTQGEPTSALSRLALDNHRDIKIAPDDVVVFSSRLIPGNEKAIARTINHLYRRGARVITASDAPVHVSGHGSAEELKIMLNLVRPDYFMPVHGELCQLSRHVHLAEETGLERDQIVLAETGDIVELDADGAHINGEIDTGMVFIDGTLEEVEEIVLRDRRHIAEDGIVLPIIAISRKTGTVQGSPEIISRGFVHIDESEELLRQAAEVVARTVESCSPEERGDEAVLKAKVHTDLKRFLRKATQRRPMIIPVVIEI